MHEGFRHQVLLYANEDDFVTRVGGFVREGVQLGEPTLVVVDARKIARLREHLDGDAAGVHFADMGEVGSNPARIIPAWRRFVAEYSGSGARSLRGVGEPIDAARGPDALVECQRHEELLNVAFAGSRAWQLLCPYDLSELTDAVIEGALRSHPYVRNGHVRMNPAYRGLEGCAAPFDAPLPEPPAARTTLEFSLENLAAVRSLVAASAADLGFDGEQARGFTLAAHEIAANAIEHAGGSGVLRLWSTAAALVAEVADWGGGIDDPLAGRIQPPPSTERGRGLWLANQLCDLVQIRSLPTGGVVRVHLYRR
jgi:anti-sigma regulatory factor (Ser/Thr protein kinase)